MARTATVVRVSFQTAHRRFGQWTAAGVWRRLHNATGIRVRDIPITVEALE